MKARIFILILITISCSNNKNKSTDNSYKTLGLTNNSTTIINPDLQDFLNGRRSKYCSDGTGNSQGLKVCINYPINWEAKEGNRPHVTQKFISQNGDGFEDVMILIQTLEPSQNIGDIDILLSEQGMRNFLPGDFNIINSTHNIVIDGEDAVSIDFNISSERNGIPIRWRGNMYAILYENFLIQIFFTVKQNPFASPIDLERKYRELNPLFNLMINSFIIETKWKNRISQDRGNPSNQYELNQSDFSILLPDHPIIEANPNTGIDTYIVNSNYYKILFSCQRIPNEIAEDIDIYSQKAQFYSGLFNSLNFRLISDRNNYYSCYKSLDFTISSNDNLNFSNGKGRIVQTSRNVFIMLYLYNENDEDLYDSFINSLQITEIIT